MTQKILFIENNENFGMTWSKVLRLHGYEIVFKSTILDALQEYQTQSFDLAIIDLRLKDDGDPNDHSGIELARQLESIPKILLTAHHISPENVQEAMNVDDIPLFMGFADKSQGPEKLLEIIESALREWPTLKYSRRTIDHIKNDHKEVRRNAKYYFRTTLALSIVGFMVIIAGMFHVLQDISLQFGQ